MPNRNYFKSDQERNKWYREYRAKNREKFRAYNREYNKNWRKKNGYHNEVKWQKNHPVKVKAQEVAQYAIRMGKLERLPCCICGKEKTVAHHPNYRKRLQVIFVCYEHHRQIHYGKRFSIPSPQVPIPF